MHRAHVLSSSELSSLRDLELVARTTVEGLRQGLHRSPFHGYSAEFSQYRHYRPGDDLKYVDWKAFGRTDRLYSRQFRETTNLATLFVVDVSRSMAFPAVAPKARDGAAGPAFAEDPHAVASIDQQGSKFALARAAAAVLATLVIDQGDAAGLLSVSDRDERSARYVPARSGRHHLHLLLAAMARLQCVGREGVSVALRRATTLLARRGLVIVLSDFYEEEIALAEIRRLARMGHDVIVFQVMAREEMVLPAAGAAEFEDAETGDVMFTNAAGVAAEYARNVAAFLTRIRQAVEREGLDYMQLVTGDHLERSLRRFLVTRRGRA
jgi:uncharacterized protein (DUF58 family)